jgi:hypothetical protein
MPDQTLISLERAISRIDTQLSERCAREHELVMGIKADYAALRDEVGKINVKIVAMSSLVTLAMTLLTHLLFSK